MWQMALLTAADDLFDADDLVDVIVPTELLLYGADRTVVQFVVARAFPAPEPPLVQGGVT